MKVYEYKSISKLIEFWQREQKALGSDITYEKLAQKLRIQKSYLSKVINNRANLNKDQGLLLARTIGLKGSEVDYLFLLIDYEKAASIDLKEHLKSKIDALANLNTQSDKYIDKNISDMSESDLQKYYLYPETQLVHIALSLSQFSESPAKLRETLNISFSLYEQIISILIGLDFIEMKKEKIKIKKSNIHLPKGSPLFHQWQTQMKLKSNEWLKSIEENDKYNFIVTFSADEKTKEKIRIEFMNFLKKVEKSVQKAPAKKMYQMSFDLFKWV